MAYLFVKSTKSNNGYTEVGVIYDPDSLAISSVLVKVTGDIPPKPRFTGDKQSIDVDASSLSVASEVAIENEKSVSHLIEGLSLENDKEYGLSLPVKLNILWH